MKLSNIAILNFTPRAKPFRMSDGRGLVLEVRPTGTKVWRYRYKIRGVESVFTIGEYGALPHQFSIVAAREARSEAQKLVVRGVHPRQEKREAFQQRVDDAQNTFGSIAREWLDMRAEQKLSPHYFAQLKSALDDDILPAIGSFNIRAVTTPQLANIITERGRSAPHMARLVRSTVSMVYTFAIMRGQADTDPTYPLRNAIGQGKGAIVKTQRTRNNPWLSLDEVPAFLAAVDAAPAAESVKKLGTKLLMLTLVRPCELAAARWEQFDMDSATPMWSVPPEIMKMETPHFVPLSRQAITLLRELRKLTGDTPSLFPERNAKVRTGDAVTKLPNNFARFIRSIGFKGKVTAHGLRATASTILNEVMKGDVRRFPADTIECQLSHLPRGVRAHYNHASYMSQRVDMMQAYADMVMPRTPRATNVVRIRNAA